MSDETIERNLRREQRLERRKQLKSRVTELWPAGVPGMDLTTTELRLLRVSFSRWSDHFQYRLLTEGVQALTGDYERLIYGVEHSFCKHGAVIRKGEEYRNCCGISYEYVNDLRCRDAVAIILDIVSIATTVELRAEIQLLDGRFRAVPKTASWIVNPNGVEKKKKNGYWWYFGLPLTVRP